MALRTIYRASLSLLTDLYQLTMAYGYWKTNGSKKEAVFHLSFRNSPFQGGFTVASGLCDLIDFVQNFKYQKEDIEYLATLKTKSGKPLFAKEFLTYLETLKLNLSIAAVPEGTIVFAQEPMVRIEGNLLECQLLESILLNFFNFQSLIATKAARVCLAAGTDTVLEFGMRRAQGIDGALTASRSAYLGGCYATSNVLAGKLFDIPVLGTHAHSWVMSFESELESFEKYGEALPENAIFLVDTYDSLNGIKNAIQVGKKLKEQGYELSGIRLDSGDFTYLSQAARKMLDEAGFQNTFIAASNDLDENLISTLKQQGSKVSVWGVGTKLVTSYDQPALGAVYKLSAIRKNSQCPWEYKIKLSDQAAKISTPGVLQVRRFIKNEEYVGDAIYDESRPLPTQWSIIDPLDVTRRKTIPASAQSFNLLVPVFERGELVYSIPSLQESRLYVKKQLEKFNSTIKRFINPHIYPAGLETSLHAMKMKQISIERKWVEGAA